MTVGSHAEATLHEQRQYSLRLCLSTPGEMPRTNPEQSPRAAPKPSRAHTPSPWRGIKGHQRRILLMPQGEDPTSIRPAGRPIRLGLQEAIRRWLVASLVDAAGSGGLQGASAAGPVPSSFDSAGSLEGLQQANPPVPSWGFGSIAGAVGSGTTGKLSAGGRCPASSML
jgi:hypothetical protein